MKILKGLPGNYAVWIAIATLSLAIQSCNSIWKQEVPKERLARVGDAYLYREDVADLLGEGVSAQDSASIITNFINNWATKQLLLSKAKINLPENQLADFEQLISNYRTDLYTRAYKEALVLQSEDTTISRSQLQQFYDAEKENFRLREKLVKLRFVELPLQFFQRQEITQKLRRFNDGDVAYLDSIGVHFVKLNFNDSIWIPASQVIQEIPPLNYDNEDRYLKKSQFFELEDSLGVYLAMVTDILGVNDIAPLSHIEPTIRQVLLNRRKLDYIRKLETEIIDEATKENEFEVYIPNE
jgi:hypothetical protein